MESAPSGPSRCVEVAAAIICGPRGVLITQRPPGSHLAGLWEFPGGKRESGETFVECLAREIHEELGLRIAIKPEAYAIIDHHYPEKSVHLRFFKARVIQGEPRAIGCSAFEWATRGSLTQYAFPEADAALLAKLAGDDALWNVATAVQNHQP